MSGDITHVETINIYWLWVRGEFEQALKYLKNRKSPFDGIPVALMKDARNEIN